ncbi:hypothetical protein ACHAW6_013706 [Cyclotella cf. meneghiniana]
MVGQCCPTKGLQFVPVNTPTASNSNNPTSTVPPIYMMNSMIQYLNQCIFSPTIDTLCKAINNNHMLSFPGLTTGDIKKSLPPSTATAKGHMHAIK